MGRAERSKFCNGLNFVSSGAKKTTFMSAPASQSAWTPKEIKLLGTKPDAELARKIGRTVEAVSLKRQKLGIEAPLQPA